LYSTKHSEQVLDKNNFLSDDSIINKLIAFKGAPLHPNELPLAIAEMKAKEDNCDIVLCGEGADDIFGGYGKNLRMYLDYNPKENYSEFLYSNYSYFSEKEIKEILNPKYYYSNVSFFERLFKEEECPSDIKNKMFYFIQRLHTKGLIERGNNALAFNGFSQGFPFINTELVEFVNSIPFDLKVKWKQGFDEYKCREINYKDISENCDVTKYILKKVGEKYLPTNIIYRPKYGFPVPFENWLKDLEDYPFDKDVFKITNIKHFSGWKKFMLINLDKFIKIHNKSKL
jgi:asparagine synthetase B (glutamine-hydrolysing)